jgi:hypothetical protein
MRRVGDEKKPQISPLRYPGFPLYWQQIPGAPHLARFSRDVGFHDSILATLESPLVLEDEQSRPVAPSVRGQDIEP